MGVLKFKMPDHSEQRVDYGDISPRSPRKSVLKFSASLTQKFSSSLCEETKLTVCPNSAPNSSRGNQRSFGSSVHNRIQNARRSSISCSRLESALQIPRIVRAEHSLHQEQSEALLSKTQKFLQSVTKPSEKQSPLLLSRVKKTRRGSSVSSYSSTCQAKSLNAQLMELSPLKSVVNPSGGQQPHLIN